MQIDYSKAKYFLNGIAETGVPKEFSMAVQSFLNMENLYASAVREITTKLETLNDEFKISRSQSPIHQIQTRVKTPKSIIEKMLRKNYPLNIETVKEKLDDIAGVRIICPYVDDLYMIASILTGQDDIELIRESDYIKTPKPNGYRSLHLVVRVPVFLSKRTEKVKVEVQLRTIAMDFWAALEHDLVYKLRGRTTREMMRELKDCADVIARTDERMQRLHDILESERNSTSLEA